MTIDERLEALTQSVELLASMHKDNEKRFKRLATYMRATAHMVLDHEARLRLLENGDDENHE